MVLYRSPTVQGVTALPRQGRQPRRPSHPFNIRHQPWQITPFFIAPVLAGETLQSLKWQARVATDPLKNQQVGWWYEALFFYIKLSDMSQSAEFQKMMIDPTWTDAAVAGATPTLPRYFGGAHIDWVLQCYNRVMDADCGFFRVEGEDRGTTTGSLYNCKLGGPDWLDSMTPDADLTVVQDINVDLNANATITAEEVEIAMRKYELLRANGAINMTWEDYLETFGIKRPDEELHIPELLRFVRQWTYPATVVDPTDGSLAGSAVWNVSESADKKRFFTEPGFIFGVTIARPKVYISGQKGSATSYLCTANAWLPALLGDDPNASWVNIPDNTLLGDLTDAGGMWVDMRDLFMYGEQFVNFDITDTAFGAHQVLPAVGGNHKYPASITAPFLGSTTATQQIRQDGLVSLTISGRQTDTSVQYVNAALTP